MLLELRVVWFSSWLPMSVSVFEHAASSVKATRAGNIIFLFFEKNFLFHINLI